MKVIKDDGKCCCQIYFIKFLKTRLKCIKQSSVIWSIHPNSVRAMHNPKNKVNNNQLFVVVPDTM
jgi:hypothetical protein